ADAVTIRKSAREAFDMSHGEWWTGGEHLKNDPVCYAGGTAPTVKAKFKVLPKINSARLSAETVGAGSPLGGLGAQTVTFANGLSDWTEFQMNATIPHTVRKADHRWAWNVSQIDGAAVTEFVCATTGPHRVYVVLDRPVEPAWRMTAGSPKNPWTNALEFVCNVANGQSTAHSALSAITSHLFYNMGFSYNNRGNGGSSYLEYNCFDLSSYLTKRYALVNCYDQAYAIAALANLLGVAAKVIEVRPFGYINPVNLIGHGFCNNPGFYEANDRMRPLDDATRSRFKTHTFALFDFQVYDACVGPVTGLGYIPYLLQTIDYSTADEQFLSALSEDERVIPLKKVETREVYLLK
ncbi:MAG: hypothetical protein IJI36_03940, partial [Kiritimatiellae bacterium]|nr:hypothetical protein [Kiritimatiellia bacterium]